VGLRVEHRPSGTVVAYSCDTEKCGAITRLARGAHLLLHEATGGFGGHTTATEAAEVAAEAGAARLVLVHLAPHPSADDLAAARAVFAATEYGEDLGRYEV
jgi:ribonuclease Z